MYVASAACQELFMWSYGSAPGEGGAGRIYRKRIYTKNQKLGNYSLGKKKC